MSDAKSNSDKQGDSPQDALTNAFEQFQANMQNGFSQWSQLLDKDALSKRFADISMDPQKVMQAQWALWQSQQQLWLSTTSKLLGANADVAEVASASPTDRRFKDADWKENPLFSHLKQSYLLNARWLETLMSTVEGLDADTRRTLAFYNQQLIDALSPTNFAMTNPEVVRTTLETNGKNLVDGMNNLLEDLARGNGSLNIRQSDETAFEVGRNIAITPGQVVYENELFQLIQYAPSTEKVYTRPLLIVPPWINKFYILDLTPESSLIKWCTEQGFTVFVMSWINPDESYKDKGFDDYVRDGVLSAVSAIEQATGVDEVNAVGYCIGGTLLAITLAYMAAKGDKRIRSATFLTALVDFEDAGCLKVFSGQDMVDSIEPSLESKGYLEGAQMAGTFNLLRSNDLIWYFVINNYLLGKSPRAFELLHWNSDSTRFPARLLRDYLRDMYQRNLLATANAFNVLGQPIDLSLVKIPTFIQATKEDHISPARSVFKNMLRFSGKRQFLLAGSGHIAGVVNPPAKGRYQFWTNENGESYEHFDDWLADAAQTPGSWWPTWSRWLARRSGKKVTAREPGDGSLKVLEPAPGSYVKQKCGG